MTPIGNSFSLHTGRARPHEKIISFTELLAILALAQVVFVLDKLPEQSKGLERQGGGQYEGDHI